MQKWIKKNRIIKVEKRKMKYPDEIDLMSFFECEPVSLDSSDVSFFL